MLVYRVPSELVTHSFEWEEPLRILLIGFYISYTDVQTIASPSGVLSLSRSAWLYPWPLSPTSRLPSQSERILLGHGLMFTQNYWLHLLLLFRGEKPLRISLNTFLGYSVVQTIASSFEVFSLSRSGCFRLPLVVHFWSSKSIREDLQMLLFSHIRRSFTAYHQH